MFSIHQDHSRQVRLWHLYEMCIRDRSDTGKIQLGNEVTVTLTTTVNLGLFGEFASFPVTLTARATGASEVYWK